MKRIFIRFEANKMVLFACFALKRISKFHMRKELGSEANFRFKRIFEAKCCEYFATEPNFKKSSLHCLLLLPSVHCLLPTAHCPLPIVHCSLSTAHCPVPIVTAHCPLSTARCLLQTAHCSQSTAHC
jgi:hypothetical protein